jgi:hypothetical protein
LTRWIIGISQRDTNHYDFWNERETQEKVTRTVREFWEENIMNQWDSSRDCASFFYSSSISVADLTFHPDTFDLLLTRSLSGANIVDFNPYSPRTDPLLFTYPDLLSILSSSTPASEPQLRVIDSREHPAATRNVPANQHNMVPREVLEFSAGRTVEEFGRVLEGEIKAADAA